MTHRPSRTTDCLFRAFVLVLLALGMSGCAAPDAEAPAEMEVAAASLPTLHHAHLNSLDPSAAAAWYQELWPLGEVGEVDGRPAFIAENRLLFDGVDSPPPGGWDPELQRSAPQSPFWHIGGFLNTTGLFEDLSERGYQVLPLWTGPEDQIGVRRSGLAPYDGVRTAAALDTATGAAPRPGGFGYVVGPDGALVELVGGPDTDPSFSHVHFYHEEPACAAAWYVEHLGMTLSQGGELPEPCSGLERGAPGWPSLEHVGTLRSPNARVVFDGGTISIYPRQCVGDRCGGERPLVPSGGQVLDHVAFQVTALDARLENLRAAGVQILEGPYDFDRGRGVLVAGPDGLSVELLELP